MWTFGLTTLAGSPIGEIVNAYERKLTLGLNRLPTAQVRLRLDDPLVDEIVAADGDVLLKIYQDSTLRFVGELMTMEETNKGWYRRLLSREGLLNQAYVLPPGFEAGTTGVGEIRTSVDWDALTARGAMQEVIPTDVQDTQLRQALADAHVAVRASAREEITFDPSAPADNSPPFVMCNFAGPLWRLSKRLLGTPYPSAARSWTDTPANDIIDAWINQTNTNHATGIVLGTRDTLYATSAGIDSSYAFKPVSEALTELQEAKVPYPIDSPPTAVAIDLFTSASDTALHGRTADTSGGVWDTNDTAVADFTVLGAFDLASRTAVSDPGAPLGKWAISGASAVADALVGVDWQAGSGGATGYTLFAGVFARYIDQNNWLLAYIDLNQNKIGVDMKTTALGQINLDLYSFPSGGFTAAPDWYTIRLLVDSSGNYTVWHYATAVGIDAPKLIGRHDELATGGDLASGKVGFYDGYTGASPLARSYDNFVASAYPGPQSFDFEVAPLDIGVGGETDIGELNVRTQIGSSTTAVFEYGYGAPNPAFGTDYIVGDYVTGRAVVNGEVRFNATFRIYGVEISIDENGRVKEVPQLVP